MKSSLSTAEARRIALASQGFARRPHGSVGTRQINSALARMSTLQIDSVNVFARSHYMPLFSRLGAYDPAQLDRLLFERRSPYVEYWAHVAAFIPAADWALFDFRMTEFRLKYGTDAQSWFLQNSRTVDWVRAELADRGPLRPAQIEQDSKQGARGPWWDWNAVKRSLEYLWLFGEVAIAGRRGFERTYALAADVIPAHALASPLSREDSIRELVRRAARSYGVATAADLADYWRINDRKAVHAALADLESAGEVQAVTVEGWRQGGRALPAWVHRDAALPRRVDDAAILTPFDPMVWFRPRAQRLFDFDYRIEIYTPAPQRRFGYYSLPVIVGDDVVGRIDLKADRRTSRLLVQSAWWEHGAPADAAERVAGELRTAATWQGLESVSVSRWGDATDAIAAALTSTPGGAPSITPRHEAGPGAASDEPALAPEELAS